MRTLILCLVVAVLALGSWLLWMSPDTAPTAPSPVPDATPTENVTPSIADAPATSEPEVVAREAVTTRDEVTNEAPPLPDDATWLELTVVDELTQQPAPDVDVWWHNEAQREILLALPAEERDSLFGDQDLQATRFGWHARTDASGKVRITPGKNGSMVMARDATRYAMGYVRDTQPPPAKGHRLELQVDQTLHVHVVDAAGGDAVGVPVGLAQYDPNQPEAPQPQSYGRPVTDAHGAMRFPHLQRHRKWNWGPRQGQPVANLVVAVISPGATAKATIDPANVPEQPVELQLAATGHLEVRFLFEGQPLPSLTRTQLKVVDDEADDNRAQPHSVPIDAQGWARFAHLPLGKTFELGEFSWHIRTTGPTLPGERTSRVLDLTEQVHVLSGRLLRPDGTPLPPQSIQAKFDIVFSSGGKTLQIDEQGRFSWLMCERNEARPTPELKMLSIEWNAGDDGALRVTVEPRPLPPGRTELGDLRFALAPLFVGGRLSYDCEGRSGARPYVEKLDGEPMPGHQGIWRQVNELQLTTGADGQFAFRGEQPEGRYRLVVMTYDHLPVEPVEFAPGASDVQIDVHCGNQAEVTCLVPDLVQARQLRILLVRPDAPHAESSSFAMMWRDPTRADHTGRTESGAESFRWRALPDGTYTLRIHAMTATPLVEIPDIMLPLPEGGDPRLRDIDLRQLVAPLRLVVHVEDSLARRGHGDVMAFVLPEPADDDWHGVMVYNGEANLPVPKGPVDLMVFNQAGRPVTLRGVQGEAEVTVGPWPSVEVTFAGTDALPEGAEVTAIVPPTRPRERSGDKRRYHTEGSSGNLTNLTRKGHSFTTVEGGKATLELPDDTASLSLNLEFAGSSISLRKFTPTQLVAGQPVTVQLDAEEVRAAITRLQQNAAGK